MTAPSTRRACLAAAAAAAALPRLHGDPLGLPIGAQTYPVRDALGKDFPGTLRQIAALHLADDSTADMKAVPVGAGVVDWKALFAPAKTGGVKNYFVEMSLDALGSSYRYLHGV
jgi:hypothetical protein